MFKFLILMPLLSLTTAAPPVLNKEIELTKAEKPLVVTIEKSLAERKSDGSFIFSFEGSDGTYREEVGIIKYPGTDEEELEVSGTYRYIDGNGELVEVKYTAGKNGFIPEGTNIPAEITQAAKLAAEAAVNEETNDARI